MTLLKPTRRDLLKLAAIAPTFALPSAALAQLTPPTTTNPAHFNFTIGDARLTILSDGYFTNAASGLGINADPAEVQNFLESHFLSTDENYAHTNHLYIELGEARVLVDVGSGTRFTQSTGRLLANMEAAGIDPDAITHVIITHAHPDHIWGIRDDFDEAIFPDAEYIIGAKEHAHWMQPDLVNHVAPSAQQIVLGAVNSINADGVDWTLAQNNHDVAPGITMIDTPGHTPGHMSLRIESAGKSLIALGDCLNHVYMNFEHPDWYNGFDMDGAQTVATRKHLLDMAATDRIAVLAYHFPFPGVGHVMRNGDNFAFVPALWQFGN